MIAATTVKPPLLTSPGFRRDLAQLAAGETLTVLKISGLPRLNHDPDPHRTHGDVPAPLLAAGQVLGRYRLLEWLGRGGQGEVWKARRLVPVEELVALKVLNPSSARNANRMAQFRREAERGLRLVGPSLLTIHEFKESNGYHFMTMPFVEGTSLRDVIKGRATYLFGDEPTTLHHFVTLDDGDYLREMTLALAEAVRALACVHEQRIVHRDIKPANILLDNRRSGGVYLCDFGLGRDLDFATPDQMRDGAGTPLYMAPERLLRFTANEVKCDIYSMGVTLYEALTLEKPFRVPDHLNLAGVAPFLAGTEPMRPCLVDPRFPEELEPIIMKAMARDPSHRHDSAHELALDLERFSAGSSSCRQRSTPPERHPSTVRPPHILSRGVIAHRSVTRHSYRPVLCASDIATALNPRPVNDALAG